MPDSVKPTPTQEAVAQRVCAALHGAAAEAMLVPTGGATESPDGVPAALKIPRWANTAAILGGRGAGKTLVLSRVLDRLEGRAGSPDLPASGESKAQRQAAGSPQARLLVLDTVDLSLAPGGFPQGVVVLQKIHQALQRRARRLRATQEIDERVNAAFQACVQASFRGQPGYEEMLRAGAASPEHYTETASREVAARLDLYQLVRLWLDLEADRAGADLFVIGIDDFDLAPPAVPGGGRVSLLWSLLDELHQSRLLFVIAADGERLASTIEAEGLPEPTATELVYKVLPRYRRFPVPAWAERERLAFSVGRGELADRDIETMVSNLQGRSGTADLRWLTEGLLGLLPLYPRGLENLARVLADLVGDTKRPLEEALGPLAEARGEHRLAQELSLRGAAGIASGFVWPGEPGPVSPAQEAELASADPSAPWLRPESPSVDLRRMGVDALRWTFLFLDAAIAAGSLSPSTLVQRIPQARAAWSAAELELEVERQPMQAWVAAETRADLAAWFWLVPEPQTEGDWYRVRVGLPALLSFQQGERSLLPDGFLRELGEEPPDYARLLGGDGDVATYVGAARRTEPPALPRRARVLLLLIFELARNERRWTSPGSAPEKVADVGRLAALLTLGALFRLRIRAGVAEDDAARRESLTVAATALGPFLYRGATRASYPRGFRLDQHLGPALSLLADGRVKPKATRGRPRKTVPAPDSPAAGGALPSPELLGGPVHLAPGEVKELDRLIDELLQSPAVRDLVPQDSVAEAAVAR